MGASVLMATRDFTTAEFIVQDSTMVTFIIQDIFSRDSIRGFPMMVFTRHFISEGFTVGSIIPMVPTVAFTFKRGNFWACWYVNKIVWGLSGKAT